MYRPRLPFARLCARYGTPEQALRAGDFLSAIAMADGDPAILAPALIMAGNEPAGLARADMAPRSPTVQFAASLGAWLIGEDEAGAEWLARLTSKAHGHAGADLLTAARATHLDGFAFYTTNPERDRFADYLKRWFGDQVTVVGHHPGHVDVCIGIDTPAEAIRRALPREPAFVLIDQLKILPRGILALQFPKIAYTTDIEFFWAARARDLDALDCIVVGNSSDLVELALRTRAPLLQRTAALTQTFEAPLRIDRTEAPRPIDIVTTGSLDSAFYPEKQIRYLAATALPAHYDVQLRGQRFSWDEYRALLSRSKYMLTSCRSTHAVLGRQIEAMAQGAMVLAPEHSGLPLLLDIPAGRHASGVVEYPARQSNAGISAALEDHDRIRAGFMAQAETLETALGNAYPYGAVGARRLVRYLHLVATMVRRGLSWREVHDGRASTGRAPRGPAPLGCSTVRFVHLTGYETGHRGAILRSALKAAQAGPQGLPFATELAAATAFESISDVNAHLLRLLDMGRARARGRVMRVLNAARKAEPDCLATWFQLGEFLYARRRFANAERVFEHILASDRLRLAERPYIIDPCNEFSDFPFVDALIRDRLDRDPRAGAVGDRGPTHNLARNLLLARVQAMQAHIEIVRNRPAAALARLERAMAMSRFDTPVHEMYLLLARVLAERTGNLRVLHRMIVVYCLGARRAVTFGQLYFPLVLHVVTALGRDRLASMLLCRWLCAKARLRIRPGEIILNEAETGAVAPHAATVERLVARWAGTPLHAALLPVLEQVARHARAA